MIKEEKRKVRSDKKKEVKPRVHYRLRECVDRISYVTNTPVKDVGAYICEAGLNSKKVIELLSEKFRKDYRKGTTFYLGDPNRPSLRSRRGEISEKKVPVTIKFSQKCYDQIADLAFALDVTPNAAAGILLDAAVRNTDVVNLYLKRHVEKHLDERRMNELKSVLKFINENNPYEEQITWGILINYLFEEFMDGTRNFKHVIDDWLDKHVQR